MKFSRGDIVEHKLSHEPFLIVDSTSACLVQGCPPSTVYICRASSRMDVFFNFYEIELKEIGVERQ